MGGGEQRPEVRPPPCVQECGWVEQGREIGLKLEGWGRPWKHWGGQALAFTQSKVKGTEGCEQGGDDTGIILKVCCGCSMG